MKSVTEATARLSARKTELIDAANAMLPGLVARGGGVRELAFRDVPRADGQGNMLVVHVLCDPCDAMGANLINQVCEGLNPRSRKSAKSKSAFAFSPILSTASLQPLEFAFVTSTQTSVTELLKQHSSLSRILIARQHITKVF